MNSSTSASSLAPARFAALFFAAALVCVAAVTGFGQWAWQRFGLIQQISPMHYQLGLVVAAGPSVTTLAVGDSHASLGFRPSAPGTMNAAFPGENTADMRVKMRYLVPRLPNLKLVLLQAQPHLFYPHRVRTANRQYLNLLEGGPGFHPFERTGGQFDPCCRARVLPEALHAVFDGQPQGYPLAFLPNGNAYFPRHPPYPLSRFPQLAAQEAASYGGRRADDGLVSEYEGLIEDLKRAGIRVVLVGYPLNGNLWKEIGEAAMQEAAARFQAIAARHELRICGNWMPLHDELHLNPDHLNPEGARRFSPLIEQCAAQQ